VNVCYYSVQKLLSSNLLSKNIKITIYRAVILPVVLYGRQGLVSYIEGGTVHRLRVCEGVRQEGAEDDIPF
jgi:hypothetical protein